jgi:hypothetical protein
MSQDYEKLLKVVKDNETLAGVAEQLQAKLGEVKPEKKEKQPKVEKKEEVVIVKEEVKVEEPIVEVKTVEEVVGEEIAKTE